jgi:hypothetical protein
MTLCCSASARMARVYRLRSLSYPTRHLRRSQERTYQILRRDAEHGRRPLGQRETNHSDDATARKHDPAVRSTCSDATLSLC